MSYILDALKKSDRERHLGQIPRLDTLQHDLAPAPARRWGWPVLLAAGLLVNAAVLGWVLSRDQAPALETVAARTGLGHAAAAPPPAAPVPSRGAPPAAAAPGVAPATAPVATRPPPSTVQGAPPRLPAAAPATPPSVPERPPAQPKPRAQAPIRDYDELPLRVRQVLPSLEINVHVYDPEPARRFVLLNMHKLREGDPAPGGARLESITPDGAVLSYQGEVFRLARQ
jgi:general secretion pathway protein B